MLKFFVCVWYRLPAARKPLLLVTIFNCTLNVSLYIYCMYPLHSKLLLHRNLRRYTPSRVFNAGYRLLTVIIAHSLPSHLHLLRLLSAPTQSYSTLF